jgi:hypothetical protein
MLQLSAVLIVILGVVLLGAYGFGFIDEGLMASLFSVVVAGGYAGFRSAIESTGKKTYILAGAMVLFGVLNVVGKVPLDKFLIIEGILGIGAAASLWHASAKTGSPSAANKIQ